MTTIRHKRGVGIPEADDLEVGEIAIDTSTGTAYTKADDGSVVPLGGDDLVITKGDYSIQVGTIDVDDDYSTAVGMKALTGGYAFGGSTSVGMDAKGSKRSVVVGQMAEARTSATAIGISARAWGDYSCSFGGGSFTDADHEYSVAIGASTKTEEPRQVMFGTAPDAPYGKPLNLKTYGTMQASDFLDADGNSIIGGGGGDVNLDWVHNDSDISSIALGWGNISAGQYSVAIGQDAVADMGAISLGNNASAGRNEFAISPSIREVNFSSASVQAGSVEIYGRLQAKQSDAGSNAFSAGASAGDSNQGRNAVAVGASAGYRDQAQYAVALGWCAGQVSQEEAAVAIGNYAGKSGQGNRATAVGYNAGANTQDIHAVAVGNSAGANAQGAYSIAIGKDAGKTNQGIRGIIISSTGSAIDNSTSGHIVITSHTGSLIFNGTNKWTFEGGPVQASGFLDADGNPATVSPSAIVDAFTTLQTAIADETTIEGIKTALTNSLGGLIERFEGMK